MNRSDIDPAVWKPSVSDNKILYRSRDKEIIRRLNRIEEHIAEMWSVIDKRRSKKFKPS